MPENPTLPGQCTDSANKGQRTLFTEKRTIFLQEIKALHTEIPRLACVVYYSVLEDLPATVRLWWNNQDKRVSSTVDKYTSKYVSNILSSQEIAAVQTSTQIFKSMVVKARPVAREVLAIYSVDDIFIELVIQLPTNYPLGSITVESGKRVGVAVQQWRNWMLQLNTFLNLQNGSIMEGLALWKTNVDKRFEGIEECMICFSVIHGSNYSLPRKACRTCKKKFHSACLYRWFTSSNKSTCPLCRETFFWGVMTYIAWLQWSCGPQENCIMKPKTSVDGFMTSQKITVYEYRNRNRIFSGLALICNIEIFASEF